MRFHATISLLIAAGLIASCDTKTTHTSLRTGDVSDASDAIGKLAPAATATGTGTATALDLPATFHDLALFQNDQISQPKAGVVPYNVKVSLFSDNMNKQRFIYLPPGQKLTFDSTKNQLTFPPGTIVVKHFSRDAANTQPIETRVIELQSDGTWSFASYQWMADGSTQRVIQETLVHAAGLPDYKIPSQKECQLCHNVSAANVLLGTQVDQLNFQQPDGTTQLEKLVQAGLLDEATAQQAIAVLPPRLDPADTSLSLDQRTRAYMDLNCGPCHNPNGVNQAVDLTLATGSAQKLEQTNVGDGPIVVAGDPTDSVIVQRVMADPNTPDSGHMPIQSMVIDPLAASLIPSWVSSLATATPTATATDTSTPTATDTTTDTSTLTATASATATSTATASATATAIAIATPTATGTGTAK